MALTNPQRARLEKLAAYLEGLPKNYRHFQMANFVTRTFKPHEKTEAEYGRTNGGVQSCGTAACAAGHGPAAGILVPPRMISGNAVDWSEYCTLFTGMDIEAEDFLFSGGWTSTDNHHYGAAARIRYLLDHGRPPENWDYRKRIYAPYRIDAKAKALA